jgi:hypothetical protein
MASYHLTAKIGMKGKAAPHAAYIAREGKYSGNERYEDLEATGYGNMPAWSAHNSAHFWQAADEYERANGSTYRELEIALPRELSKAQRLALVQDFINEEISDKYAYQFAIHTPKAAIDKDDQPHAHIMYSERIRDGIERDPKQYFKRYNTKHPENGGAKKYSGGKKADELKAELIATRERWANIQNTHLEKHGHSERVTHLSLNDQGIERIPEKHIGIRAYKMNAHEKNALIDRRTDAKEHTAAASELAEVNFAEAIRAEKQSRAEKVAADYGAFKQRRQEEREREASSSQQTTNTLKPQKKDIDLDR